MIDNKCLNFERTAHLTVQELRTCAAVYARRYPKCV